MEHTYLRYEGADAFGLTVAGGSSKAPQSNAVVAFLGNQKNALLLSTAGSYCLGLNLRTGQVALKLGHREQLSGGVGTGRALNSAELVCIDVAQDDDDASLHKVATGWVDGAVRVFEVQRHEITHKTGLVHSLIHENDDEEFAQREPLVLNGHNESPIRSIVFDSANASRLASGSSDGSVVLWDVVAETGLFRLLGHRGGVSDIMFLHFEALDGLVTTSLDGTVKIWDLQAQCCTETLAAHRGEVLTGALARVTFLVEEDAHERWRLVTGSQDGRACLWSVAPTEEKAQEDEMMAKHAIAPNGVCRLMGQLLPPPNVATSDEKVQCVRFHRSGQFVGVLYHASKAVDVYIVRTAREADRKRQRRLRRKQEKANKKSNENESSGMKRGVLDDVEDVEMNVDEHPKDDDVDVEVVKASDEFEYICSIRASHKVRSFLFAPTKDRKEAARVACALSTNCVELHAILPDGKGSAAPPSYTSSLVSSVDMQGHPTGIRSIVLSTDDRLACTVSKNATKIWNVENRSVIQAMSPAGSSTRKHSCYGLCAAFLPGNSHVVLGTREGDLIVLDVSAGDVVHVEEKAHAAAIWSIDVRHPTPNDPSVHVMTGSADKSVKFWDLEVDDGDGNFPITVHTRTLQMTDDVVAAKYSYTHEPTKRLVFVSTLDSCIKVFFNDSLRLFLSLYGHKLPALAIDASDDDAILASGGADKTIKIWGLDFGDTHRTLLGHEDSITDVKFVRRTHNFFTSSKDGTVRYWDGDRFEQILVLPGHFAEVNCLAIARNGATVLSGGMDRQVRVWERTKDIVFLQEERERRLEQAFDKIDNREDGGTAYLLQQKLENDDDDPLTRNLDEPQSEAAVRKSVLSVAAGDRLLEALEKADEDTREIAAFRKQHGTDKARPPNPMMLNMTPIQYIHWILRSIKSTDLEQSLLIMPLSHIERLLYYLVHVLRLGQGIELCSQVAVFVVKIHQKQIIADRTLAVPLRELQGLIRQRVKYLQDTAGYDLAALKLIGRLAQDRKVQKISDDQPQDIWAGLGMGSDVAAALQGRPEKKRPR